MKAIEYIIIEFTKFTSLQLEVINNECITPIISSRHNNSKTKCIIKVQINKIPQYCDNLIRYSLSEIKEVIKSEDWQ